MVVGLVKPSWSSQQLSIPLGLPLKPYAMMLEVSAETSTAPTFFLIQWLLVATKDAIEE
jgi:hypothetical protein